MEQLVLFPEGLILFVDVGLCYLERHVLVGNFGDIGDEEHSRETKDEDPNGQVYPLYALQGSYIILCACEEDIGAQDGADDCTDGVEGLGEVDSDFGVAWRATD